MGDSSTINGIGNKCCDKTGAFLPGVTSKQELDEIKECFLEKLPHPSLRL